ncbi:MAG: hypothetical protein A2W91_05500 [Bacteroidetes bacterium GWF2_38_335]|nr:MAG: hypothetical protein A2W91_05500 [Bacteroidetes bacterium GWF2_38_335]HBS88101.1 hypothetical protein [Bacteroidales bacterium]
MKLLTTVIIFAWSACSTNAQVVFNKLFPDTHNTFCNAIVKMDSSFIVCSSDDGNFRGVKLHKFDEIFNKIDSLLIVPEQLSIYEGGKTPMVINDKEQLVLLTTDFNHSNDSNNITITCLNEYLDTVWFANYLKDTMDIAAFEIIKTIDKGYAVCGAVFSNTTDYNVFLLKTDSLGNQEWVKYYGYANTDGATCLIQTPDSGFMLAGDSRKYDMYRSDWYIIRSDSLGNQVWDWIIQNPGFDDGYINDLIQTQDGNFIAVGGKTYGSDYVDNFSYSRLLKFDINKNVIKDTLYLEPYYNYNNEEYPYFSKFTKIVEMDNGNLLTINMTADLPEQYRFFPKLYELSPNGEVLKKRPFHSIVIGTEGYPMVAWNDCFLDLLVEPNGIILVGFSINPGINEIYPASQNIWLVKTDEDYCDNFGSCDTTFHVQFLNLPDTVKIGTDYNLQFRLFGDRQEYLYNICLYFRTSQHTTILRVEYPFVAIDSICSYLINYDSLVAANVGEPLDSVYVAYSTYYSSSVQGYFDYSCPWYSYKIIFSNTYDVEEISEPNISFKAFPNPVNDILQIEYISLTGSGSINIYDLQGRKLITIPIKDKMGFEQVDVSSLPTGTYIVTDGELGSKNSIKVNVQH